MISRGGFHKNLLSGYIATALKKQYRKRPLKSGLSSVNYFGLVQHHQGSGVERSLDEFVQLRRSGHF